jgi:dihydrofolate reductase
LFEQCIDEGLIEKLYITRIHKDFPADTYFPVFEDEFILAHTDKVEDIDRLTGELVDLEFQEWKSNC